MSKFTTRFAFPAIAALSLAAAVAAHAESPTVDNSAFVASKTRAQVQAELVAAREDGSIKVWSSSYNPLLTAKLAPTPRLTREQRSDEFARQMVSEDSGSFYLSSHQPARVAGRVLAQAAR